MQFRKFKYHVHFGTLTGEASASGRQVRGLGVRAIIVRNQAVHYGNANIKTGVIAAPSANPFGKAIGVGGTSACGPPGFVRCSVLHVPSFCDRIPVIVDRATTLCGGRPAPPSVDHRTLVAVARWVDRAVLDTVFKVPASGARSR